MRATLEPETLPVLHADPKQDHCLYSCPSVWRLATAAVLLAAGCAAFAIDLPVARGWSEGGGFKIPGDLRRFLDLCEVYAHGLGVAMVAATVLVLDWQNRVRLPRILACAYLGGLFAVSFKLWIERIRPGEFLKATADAGATSVWESFRAVGSFWHNDAVVLADLKGHAVQSFPSGHAATAVGLAAALAWRYPQGRWLFAIFAALACLQRINSQAHWTSDVLIGAGCGLIVAECFLGDWGLGKQFAKLESGEESAVSGNAAA